MCRQDGSPIDLATVSDGEEVVAIIRAAPGRELLVKADFRGDLSDLVSINRRTRPPTIVIKLP